MRQRHDKGYPREHRHEQEDYDDSDLVKSRELLPTPFI